MMTHEGEQIFVNFEGVETAVGRDRAIMIHIRSTTMGVGGGREHFRGSYNSVIFLCLY